MKGCARTCVLWLIGVVAAAAAFFVYLRRFGWIEPGIYWASGGAGVCLGIVVSYIAGIWNTWRERSSLLSATTGAPPVDGQWTVVSGQISSREPLTAPFSGATAVMYEYKIFRMERSGKSSTEVTYWEGKALAPSTISTRTGAVRLLAVPNLEVDNAKMPYMQALERAREYVANTNFETRATMSGARHQMEQEMTDDDGVYRFDRRSDRDVDIADCELREKHVKNGETVCAFGIYSSSRGGIVPHPNWAKQTRIMTGDANTVAGKLMKRIVGYFIGLIIFSGAVYGIVRAYMHFASLAQ